MEVAENSVCILSSTSEMSQLEFGHLATSCWYGFNEFSGEVLPASLSSTFYTQTLALHAQGVCACIASGTEWAFSGLPA